MDHLTTEQQNPDSDRLDEMSAAEIVALMNAQDATVAAAVATQQNAIAQSIELIAQRFRDGGRLFYIGAGTSGRLGVLDASECPPTFRTPPEMVVGIIAGGQAALTRAIEGAEDDPAQGAADLASHNFTAKDILVGIATSGRTPYVLGAMQHARQTGATVIGLSCNVDSEMEQHANTTIVVVVGPEVISGSTRLKSGTATKLVLNMLSTGAMVLLGKTYGNLMVDLRATNSKLMDRSIRIVRQLTNVSAGEAREQLKRCDGSVKQTVVAIRGNVSPTRAGEVLYQSGGKLRAALSKFEKASASTNKPSSDLYIGVDGGGTKTTAILGKASDDGPIRIVGQGTSGPSNPNAVGTRKAASSALSAIESAFESAKIPPQKFCSLYVGLAGAADPTTANLIADQLRARKIADHVSVGDDVRPVFEAARKIHSDETGNDIRDGIALIAGTGSIACGYLADGSMVRSGGWGWLLGDEGSGYSIAIAALKACCRAADGRAAHTSMLDVFLKHLGLDYPDELKNWIYSKSTGKKDIAALAHIVFSLHDSDQAASEIVTHASNELTETVLSIMQKTELGNKDLLLAMSGGLLVHQPILKQKILDNLEQSGRLPAYNVVVADPVMGSLHLALSHPDR